MKKFFEIVFRILTLIYSLFTITYGAIFVSDDLTQTIDFINTAAASTARQTQLCIGIPYIILGTLLLTILSLFYIARHLHINLTSFKWYGISISIIGALLTIGFVGIAIWQTELSLLICIIPSIFMLVYGFCSVIAYKKTIALPKSN